VAEVRRLLAVFLVGTFLACCPPALAEQKAPQIPADRWLEIDLYWFNKDNIQGSANQFWERFAPLYEGVTGWKGAILSVGLIADYILDWRGNLDDLIPIPKYTSPSPWFTRYGQLTGVTEERMLQWHERMMSGDRSLKVAYQDWTYRDLQKLTRALRSVGAEKYGVQDFHVGSYVVGWDHYWIYGDSSAWAKRHPGSYIVPAGMTDINLECRLPADLVHYGAFPNGVQEGMPIYDFFGAQWGSLSKAVGLDAILMKDSFFGTGVYRRTGPYGRTAPAAPEKVESWSRATGNLVKALKLGNPRALVICQSSANSAIADWRVNLVDLEFIAQGGYMDAYLDQTWAGAWNEVGVRETTFWNAPFRGWTYHLNYVLLHAAILAKTKVHHYVLTETFDAWESWDVIHTAPERLKWGIWAYLHAAVKTPSGLKMPAGSYISWANQGKRLLPPEDVAFLKDTINAATLDARNTTEVDGPTLVYSRSPIEWQNQHAPDISIKEWLDEQAGTVMKWSVPIFSSTRLEWMPQVKSAVFVLHTPVHLQSEERNQLLQMIRDGQPVAIFGSPAGGLDPEIASEIGIETNTEAIDTTVEYKTAKLGELRNELTEQIPDSFSVTHLFSENRAKNGVQVIYKIKDSPVLLVNSQGKKKLIFWDPPEVDDRWGREGRPLAEVIGSPFPWVMVARALNGFLKEAGGPYVENIDVGQAVSACYWRLADGSRRVLVGNLEEGLRFDADFLRHVRVKLPASWKPVSAFDAWHDKTESDLRNDWQIELGQAECKLYKVDKSGNHD
jgi:hypothetical protein